MVRSCAAVFTGVRTSSDQILHNQLISGTLAIIYILIPVAALLANGRIWRKRIAVLPLFGVTALVGFAFLLVDVKVYNMELRYERSRDSLQQRTIQ